MPRLLAIAAITYGLLLAGASCAADDDLLAFSSPPPSSTTTSSTTTTSTTTTAPPTTTSTSTTTTTSSTTTTTTTTPPPTTTRRRPSEPVVDLDGDYGPTVERWVPYIVDAIARYGGPVGDDAELTRWRRVMHCESRGLPDAYNPSGASGLMQQMRRYWPERAVAAGYTADADPFDGVVNINVSAWLLYQAAGGGWGHWVCK